MSEKARQYIHQYQRLVSKDANWMNLYQECADYYMPSHAVFNRRVTEGEQRPRLFYDAFGAVALSRFSAGLFGNLSPNNIRWFQFIPVDLQTRRDIGAMQYLEELSRFVEEYIRLSNFENQMHEAMLSLGCFGMCALSISFDNEIGLNFANHYIGDIYCIENARRIVDTVYRRVMLTAQQAYELFGDDLQKCQRVFNELKREPFSDRMFHFVHICHPRWVMEDDIPLSLKIYPYASVWLSVDDQVIVRQTASRRHIYHIARFLKTPDETRGRSPAMLALPHIKIMNELQRNLLEATQKVVNPPIVASAETTSRPLSTQPGAVNYCEGTPDMWPRELAIRPDIAALQWPYTVSREAVIKLFHNDLFDILDMSMQEGTKSQLEVMQRAEERFVLLYPVIGRLQSELYSPVLKDIVDILVENKQLDISNAPFNLIDADGALRFDIEYVSRLSLSVKRREVSATMELMNVAMQLGSIAPEVLDNFNFDSVVRGLGVRYGVPSEFYADDDMIAQKRQQRQELVMTQVAQTRAKTMSELGKPVDKESILGSVFNKENNE